MVIDQNVITILYFLLSTYVTGSLLGIVRYIICNFQICSLPRDAQLLDHQVSCFPEGSSTLSVMTRSSSWLNDPVLTWGMLRCKERVLSPHDFRNHVQVYKPAVVGRLCRSAQVGLFPHLPNIFVLQDPLWGARRS